MRRGPAGLEIGGFRVFRCFRLDHIHPPAVRQCPDFHAENDRGPDHPVFAGLRCGEFAVSSVRQDGGGSHHLVSGDLALCRRLRLFHRAGLQSETRKHFRADRGDDGSGPFHADGGNGRIASAEADLRIVYESVSGAGRRSFPVGDRLFHPAGAGSPRHARYRFRFEHPGCGRVGAPGVRKGFSRSSSGSSTG